MSIVLEETDWTMWRAGVDAPGAKRIDDYRSILAMANIGKL